MCPPWLKPPSAIFLLSSLVTSAISSTCIYQITLLPAVHFLEQAFAGADFSTEKFSAALSLISAALFQCPKIAKFSVALFLNFRAISVALFQLPKVVKFSVAHLQTSERVQNWAAENIRNRIACMMVQWFKNLAQNIGWDEIISTEGSLGEGLPKKVAVLLDFVQLRGGRALPKFFVHFSQTVY